MSRRAFLNFQQYAGAKLNRQNGLRTTQDAPRKTARRNASLTQQQLDSRFVQQATFGPTMADISHVADIGIEGWIDEQFATPQTVLMDYQETAIRPVYQIGDIPLGGQYPFRWSWWQAVMRGPDLLRQRMQLALSEIFVISTRADELEDAGQAVTTYHDMLGRHAFGNFRDLLFDVSMHPAMGFYLSHAKNKKADPSVNRFPDENFAREVMQLFSIGLFELNLDGTRKKDGSGKDIPTYDNNDIKEFAKIFTGLGYAEPAWFADEEIVSGSDDAFEIGLMEWDTADRPMRMYPQFHEPGEKRLLNGTVIPAGQDPMRDIHDTIDHLFNHPNVGPFIGRLLIQRLVKSNPTHAYIGRVAAAFNNNGSGVRGDMRAVIKAILLDDEARNIDWIADPGHGMLREPIIRYTQICRAMEVRNEQGEDRFWNDGGEAGEFLNQYPYLSPSVFNFFMPDYQPLGPLLSADVDAPEFQIMTSVTAINIYNFFERIIFDNWYMFVPEGRDESSPPDEKVPTVSAVMANFDPYMAFQGDVNALINRLDLLLTYGSLSAEMRTILQTNVSQFWNETNEWEETVKFALLLFMTSPEYSILK